MLREKHQLPALLGGALLGAALLAGCSTLETVEARVVPDAPLVRLASATESCVPGARAPETAGAELDPTAIRFVNWNIQKGGAAGWNEQLAEMVSVAEETAGLVTLQEVPLTNPGWEDYAEGDAHAFAPGFAGRGVQTGVMTISSATPLVQCNLTAREPILRTKKATVVTEYALAGRDDSLLVINIHAINFAPGLAAYKAQLDNAEAVIARHEGPVIFSGDFNTWRQARLETLESLIDLHGLTAVTFDNDQRKRFLGQALDHVYVRGLDVVDADTLETTTSDHNPMLVWLSAG